MGTPWPEAMRRARKRLGNSNSDLCDLPIGDNAEKAASVFAINSGDFNRVQ